MRKIVLPLALASLAGISGSALAADTMIGGTVKSYDQSAHRLTLENGATYTLPSSAKNMQFKAGDMVQLQAASGGTTANMIEPIIQGKVRSLKPAAHTLTLGNGKTYRLPQNFDAASVKAGENVGVVISDGAAGSKEPTASQVFKLAEGRIKSFDPATGKVTLSDGQTYFLPKGGTYSTLKVGQNVTIPFTTRSGRNDAEMVISAS